MKLIVVHDRSMRSLALTTTAVILFVTLWSVFPGTVSDHHISFLKQTLNSQSQDVGLKSLPEKSGTIIELERYDDPDYGFSLAVPEGWSKIVSADAVEGLDPLDPDWLEPGYAVGFESPRSGESDVFADYILIEVLPGTDNGLFDTGLINQHKLEIGAEVVYYDRLDINSKKDTSIDVDLVIFQRGVQAFGYTLAFYAVGEPANEQVLFDAFKAMLRTFSQTSPPFVVI